MASLLSGWNPIKFFPPYHGPYDVGTVDVEIPVADLPLPSGAPEDAQPTIAFRIFYPCEKPKKDEVDRPVRWIPQPQRATIASFAKFLGLPQKVAGAFSYIPQQLYWIKLPAHRNARLLDPPTGNGRWPVTVFSHGLAGSRNAYSQICGDLAANGMIVIALDHRDGSSPIQYVRATSTTEAHIVYPTKIPHHPVTDAVYEGRDKQLRIRLWEMSMAYEALIKIDKGHNIENLDSNTSKLRKERMEVLWQFNDMMDIHTPGKVTWSGHSFGAATTVQLLKSIFYYRERNEDDGKALIRPNADAAIIQQIVPESPTLLLDMWGLPLQSPFQKFLWDRPLPSYALGGPNGANLLSILSEAFQNWEDNLNINKAFAAKPSMSRRPSRSSDRTAGPHMFYVGMTQHFNQSDFGIVFPYIALRVTKAQEPVRCLELNTRAMVQVIREAGIEVAGENDKEILDKESGIRNWVPIPVDEEDERQTSRPGALQAIDRKLSVTSTKSMSSPRLQPRDGMTMGQKMQAQLEFSIG
ncbi:hypothetical protein EJ03DRAFT_369752 [Teratosphaeria nubilosa]|uniref:Putative phospholipase n=1 Tax=Teratosphaeria nubilosa TaxID=161662 RepID=A0A6G1KX38_9PEZI|nr:hypothetical protein EJ03DRAFT_369752 [Teratosphaeria nubilosa]